MRLLSVLCLIGYLGAQTPAPSSARAFDAPAPTHESELLAKIRRNHIDPAAIYHVRELPITREDARFYLVDGVLALFEPMNGRVTGAIFVGEGETLLMPPDISEKRSVAEFLGTPVLNEKFTAAYLRFGDASGAELAAAIKEHTARDRPDPTEFMETWGPVVQNLNLLYDLRLMEDLLVREGPPVPEQAGRGFFAAHLFGQRLGAFDIMIDPLSSEQISAGQSNWKDGRRFVDRWCSFVSSSVRNKRAAAPVDPMNVSDYRISAKIQDDRQMDVTAVVNMEAKLPGERMVTFQLSSFLNVISVDLENAPLTFYHNESIFGETPRENNLVTVVLPAPTERGRRYSLTFHYAGGVISDAGRGVLYVGARGIWFPQRTPAHARFDLTFRFPRKLSLVATGDLQEQHDDGDYRVAHWKTKDPVMVAGFNIGDYESGSAKTSDGLTLTIYANRDLEPALAARRRPTVTEDTSPPLRGTPVPPVTQIVTPPPPPPSPASVAADMARDLAPIVEFYTRNFGPLPFRHVAISPVPGRFGQGWPGLIYLSTTSYLMPYDRASKPDSPETDLQFSVLLPAHEVAHQWWGHITQPGSYRDEWLVEALASYSALLWVEQRDRSGPRDVRAMLANYRENLLHKTDGETAESAGPLALGRRLDNSHTPNGAQAVFYDKGPWVIHMLRQLMRDPKTGSDAGFFRFLRALCEEFTTRPLTIEGFRELAEKYVEPKLNADTGNQGKTLDWFFDQWVYGTGIPEVKMASKLTARTAAGKIDGTATLEGVEPSWILPVPMYVQTARGERLAGVAVAAASGDPNDVKFSLRLTAPATKVLTDPQQTLLVVWKER